MDVSIIIVNYNTVDLLVDAIASVISKTEGISYEVIVVDNASRDDSESIVARTFQERVRYVRLDRNIGFGRANNKGIELARGRNIFLLNPDTLLVNNAVKILSDYLDNDPRTGACGGNLYTADMQPATSFERYLPSLGLAVAELLHLYDSNKHQFNHTGKPMKVGYISGADMMLKKEVLDKVGYFDPDFFMYAEETELSYRIRKAGYISVSVPESKIIHLEGQSFREISPRRIKMQFSGRSLYFRKRYGKSGAWIFEKIKWLEANLYILVFRILRKDQVRKEWQVYKSAITSGPEA